MASLEPRHPGQTAVPWPHWAPPCPSGCLPMVGQLALAWLGLASADVAAWILEYQFATQKCFFSCSWKLACHVEARGGPQSSGLSDSPWFTEEANGLAQLVLKPGSGDPEVCYGVWGRGQIRHDSSSFHLCSFCPHTLLPPVLDTRRESGQLSPQLDSSFQGSRGYLFKLWLILFALPPSAV